jgi:hypothetical protein
MELPETKAARHENRRRRCIFQERNRLNISSLFSYQRGVDMMKSVSESCAACQRPQTPAQLRTKNCKQELMPSAGINLLGQQTDALGQARVRLPRRRTAIAHVPGARNSKPLSQNNFLFLDVASETHTVRWSAPLALALPCKWRNRLPLKETCASNCPCSGIRNETRTKSLHFVLNGLHKS